eukprot:COSAG05_NODE_15061_length_379_cov_1.071429_1_plen_38_part_10
MRLGAMYDTMLALLLSNIKFVQRAGRSAEPRGEPELDL